MAKTIVGLEVTEESVRAAELSLGRRPQLIAYGEVPLPPDAARDSEVLDPGAVAVALRQLWTGARFKSKTVVLGVASRRILVREYTTQAMRPDLLREALPYQVQDLLPVPASQAVLDFFPLSQEGDQVSGLLVAAVSENIEQIIATLSKIKVRTQAVDLAAFGLARITAPLTAPEETVATINIGDHTTQVVISQAGVPRFVRILPIDVATAAARRHTRDRRTRARARIRGRRVPRARVARYARRPRPELPTSRHDCAARSHSSPAAPARWRRRGLRHRRRRSRRRRHPGPDGGDRHPHAPSSRSPTSSPCQDHRPPARSHSISWERSASHSGRCADERDRHAPFSGVPRVNLMPRSEVARRERDGLVRMWVWIVFGAIIVALLVIAGAFGFKFVGRPGPCRRAGAHDRPARRDRRAVGGESSARDRV